MDININDKAYKFPTGLTMEQWAHIVEHYDFYNYEDHADIIHYLTEAPLDILKAADPEILELAMAFVIRMANVRVPVDMINFEDLTFGQFIDLDIYLNMGVTKYYKEILEILGVDKEGAEFCMYAIETYNKYRVYIYRQYKKLFEIEDSAFDEDVEQEAPTDNLSVARNWYRIIVELAHQDILKIDEVTDQPLKKALNFMAYAKEQQLEENMRKLQQKREYDLQRNRRSH